MYIRLRRTHREHEVGAHTGRGMAREVATLFGSRSERQNPKRLSTADGQPACGTVATGSNSGKLYLGRGKVPGTGAAFLMMIIIM